MPLTTAPRGQPERRTAVGNSTFALISAVLRFEIRFSLSRPPSAAVLQALPGVPPENSGKIQVHSKQPGAELLLDIKFSKKRDVHGRFGIEPRSRAERAA